ncbi:MAG: DNA topoisomerase, partial [Ruminococcaceae bacterium]|nr:DNA topoisomerase [Oscillospiraceae bacterium]
SAEKERLNIKKKLTGNLDMTNRIAKFIDCRTKDRELRELYIVEGDSAAGACKQGRSAEFQAIMPVRGKILNCLKADLGKIFNSDIIVDLIKILGCGVEVQSKKNKELSSFDIGGLRWKRVIICTDADVDGFQIRTLILTMIYRLMPSLIKEGFVYIAESPLYEINCGNDTYFAYSDAEKNEIVEKIGKSKYTIQRSKGLGENEPDMMWKTTMNPETRRLIKVVPDMAEAAIEEMFDLLLGENLADRKTFIAENGWKYIDEADVS